MRQVRGGGWLLLTDRGEHIATIPLKAKARKEEAFVDSSALLKHYV